MLFSFKGLHPFSGTESTNFSPPRGLKARTGARFWGLKARTFCPRGTKSTNAGTESTNGLFLVGIHAPVGTRPARQPRRRRARPLTARQRPQDARGEANGRRGRSPPGPAPVRRPRPFSRTSVGPPAGKRRRFFMAGKGETPASWRFRAYRHPGRLGIPRTGNGDMAARAGLR